MVQVLFCYSHTALYLVGVLALYLVEFQDMFVFVLVWFFYVDSAVLGTALGTVISIYLTVV